MSCMRNIHSSWIFIALAVLMALAAGCGGDSLKLSLPDGNVVKYMDAKPSGSNLSASCSTQNAAALADSTETGMMKISCSVLPKDASGASLPTAASIRIVAEVKDQGNAPQDGVLVHFTTTKGSFEPFGDAAASAVKETDAEISSGSATANLYTFPGEQEEGRVTASFTTMSESSISDSTQVIVTPGIGFMVESACGMARVESASSNEAAFELTPSSEPMDVEPLSGEPNHMVSGIIHNPRDGLLSIVFYVDGEEGYTDSNSNGKYDSGEPFFGNDLAEPFVDANDNGEYDSGEGYIDVDGDGQWSDANGRWDGETVIWTMVHIMFTGKPDESIDTTHFEPSGINIDSGGSQQFTLYLMDINHNPIASNTGSDHVEFNTDSGANVVTGTITLTKSMGIEFTDDGKVDINSLDKNHEDRYYQVTLDDSDPDAVESVTLHTLVEWTPAPPSGDYSPTMMNQALGDLTGTAN
ncbi:MAG TPA: hypothetical protein VM425_16440 [Myxococcota bacterium]|nr:hypothetical protein [Myxococcota bacterium]